jgi:hypothetical protein
LADDTAAVQAIFSEGGELPAGCFKLTDTIMVPSNVAISGAGAESMLRLVLPAGSPARPVLDLSGSGIATTTGIALSDFSIDAGAISSSLAAPIIYGANPAAGSAILVQSSNTTIHDLTVDDAWDNGIMLFQAASDQGSQTNGQPSSVEVANVTCTQDGAGDGLGGCVDAGTASGVNVHDSVDHGSATGFIVDYWGGTTGRFDNLVASNSVKNGFYIGAPGVALSNLRASSAGTNGMWIDFYAGTNSGSGPVGGTLDGFVAEGAQRNGLLIEASGWSIANASVSSADQLGKDDCAAYVFQQPGAVNAPYVASPVTGTSVTNIAPREETWLFAPNGNMTLAPGQQLGDDHVFIIMQTDGNLVVYVDYVAKWSSATNGHGCEDGTGCHAVYQADGNFVIYDASGSPQWTSNTAGSSELRVYDRAPYLAAS